MSYFRRPPARETVRDHVEYERGVGGLGYDWVMRYSSLRKRGLVMPLLKMCDDGISYLVATDPTNLWGSKIRVSVQKLREQIEQLEGKEEAA